MNSLDSSNCLINVHDDVAFLSVEGSTVAKLVGVIRYCECTKTEI